MLSRAAESPRQSSGSGTLVVCPSHADSKPSLHVSQGHKGALLKCFAGCATEAIAAGLGLELRELFDDGGEVANGHRPHRPAVPAKREPVSLASLAEKFRLPREHLASLGLSQSGAFVAVPYRDESGVELYRKLRASLSGSPKYTFPREFKERDLRQSPYGLDRLPDARRQARPALVLVEGESDCWVLWHRGVPALGIPGASSVACLERAHLDGIREVFVVREPGKGGDTFVDKLAERLGEEFSFDGEARVVSLPDGVKDSADLWRRDPSRFDRAFGEACRRAVPLVGEDVADLVLSLDQYERREVRFLWHPYIPLGKVSILAGKPGQGKSFITMALMAALSVGAALPGGVAAEPCSSLLFSAEDDPSEVLRPRVEDNGGDLRRVLAYRVERGFSFGGESFALLERLIRKFSPRLVVFDPLVSFLGGRVNINRQNEVRQALQPLIDIAQRTGVAILIVAHVTKGTPAAAIDQIMGSVDFSAAVRSALIAYPDPDKLKNEEGGIVAHAKHNLSKGGASLRYVIDGNRFMWRGESDKSASELSAISATTRDEKRQEEFARKLLLLELEGGPKLARDVTRMANEQGISRSTLARARWDLGVGVRKRGYQGPFEWYMPTAEEAAAADASPGRKRRRDEDDDDTDREKPPW